MKPIIYNKSNRWKLLEKVKRKIGSINNYPGNLHNLKEAVKIRALYRLLSCVQWGIEVPKLFIV